MGNNEHEKHHILGDDTSRNILLALLVLTVVTVLVAQFDFGKLNFPIAMLIATFKAMLVVRFFMGMKYDKVDNKLFFSSGVIFFLVFVIFVATDMFSRGDYRVTGSEFADVRPAGGAVFREPWKPTEEILAHGKKLYDVNCVSCHGDQGAGNGVAAAALNPRPRNFQALEGWKNGRTLTAIYRTLTVGLGLMPQYNNLPPIDRWALSHYVLAFNAQGAPEPSAEEFKAAGLNIEDEFGGLAGEAKKTVPVDFALERYLEAQGSN